MIFVLIIGGLFIGENKEFFEVSSAQRAEGYTWQKTDCRPVNPQLPALTMDTALGKNRICYKLEK